VSCLVHFYPEPFRVKDLCNPRRWYPEQGPQQRLKVRKAPEVNTNVIQSNIEREMGQEVSKEQARFTEILCSMLCNRGYKVS
jgi:hypothetical protein